MTKMLGAVRPGHGQTCRYAGRGCTCFLYRGEYGPRAKKLRRRAARHAERRAWRQGAC